MGLTLPGRDARGVDNMSAFDGTWRRDEATSWRANAVPGDAYAPPDSPPGGILALVGIVASLLFGFEMGTWFSVAMIGFAGVAVLYDTSNILHHYPEDRYVGAALQLFASVALMFWYVLRLYLSRRE